MSGRLGARPRIGLSACLLAPDPARDLFKGKQLQYLERSMANAVWAAGGTPLLLPDLAEPDAIEAVLDSIDGVLLQGGADVDPVHYGEEPIRPEWRGDAERDRYEIALIGGALARSMPILGVCRGHQILNVALGGSLLQDISTQVEGSLTHRDPAPYDALGHGVRVDPRSWLATLYHDHARDGVLAVNSVHHQGIKDLADDLLAIAHAPDGVIEAVVHRDSTRWVRGVQWHPEWLDQRFPERVPGDRIFTEFVRACAGRA